MESLGDITEESTAADGRLPRILVHGELLEMLQVDHNGFVFTAADSYWIVRISLCSLI